MDTSATGPRRVWPWLLGIFLFLFVSVCLVAAVAAASYVYCHNRLMALDVRAETQWKQVENQLVRQYELLPQLARVAERYAKHERGLLEKLATARTRYQEEAPRERPELAEEMDSLVISALSLQESYPRLAADDHFRDLAFEIAGTKNRIAVERRRYNEAVGRLNTRLQQFPFFLAAGDLEAREFYEPQAKKLEMPELSLQ